MNFPQHTLLFKTIQSSSVAQWCPTLCDPMDCSMPGFSIHHQLPEFTQPHVHWVSDAIHPSHPLSPPSPPAINLSQHQALFQRFRSSHQVAKSIGVSASASVLPMNIQDWFPLGWTGWISLQCIFLCFDLWMRCAALICGDSFKWSLKGTQDRNQSSPNRWRHHNCKAWGERRLQR